MDTLFLEFFQNTGFYLCDYRNIIMIIVGMIFIFLGIAKDYEPLLLVPIGFGMLVGNIPLFKGMGLGIYEKTSVLSYLYFGVTQGIYPPLIFLGIGAMTDFSTLLTRPILMLLGAAAQAGIFITFLGALALGFLPKEAAAIG
ncbi:MAG TPA: sodium ion-translocating decarboxylase subunit beta, partial [Desulfobacter postgatei]|nr:sodium ion-translocating decarboxylase subunit beta [Desulfobacter postgatei]